MGENKSKKQFTTIDDAMAMVPNLEKLTDILKELGERKHPLSVRRGMTTKNLAKSSSQVEGTGCTYSLDIEKAQSGTKYLRITQSKKGSFQKSSVYILPKDAQKLQLLLAQMLTALNHYE